VNNSISYQTSGLMKGLMLLLFMALANSGYACGGFFCSFTPIDQAGEQIVFRQSGNEVTAMIKIDYAGRAEDFGWVLPIPTTPEISLGSDQIFPALGLCWKRKVPSAGRLVLTSALALALAGREVKVFPITVMYRLKKTSVWGHLMPK